MATRKRKKATAKKVVYRTRTVQAKPKRRRRRNTNGSQKFPIKEMIGSAVATIAGKFISEKIPVDFPYKKEVTMLGLGIVSQNVKALKPYANSMMIAAASSAASMVKLPGMVNGTTKALPVSLVAKIKEYNTNSVTADLGSIETVNSAGTATSFNGMYF